MVDGGILFSVIPYQILIKLHYRIDRKAHCRKCTMHVLIIDANMTSALIRNYEALHCKVSHVRVAIVCCLILFYLMGILPLAA